jgi:hypothetical protein
MFTEPTLLNNDIIVCSFHQSINSKEKINKKIMTDQEPFETTDIPLPDDNTYWKMVKCGFKFYSMHYVRMADGKTYKRVFQLPDKWKILYKDMKTYHFYDAEGVERLSYVDNAYIWH